MLTPEVRRILWMNKESKIYTRTLWLIYMGLRETMNIENQRERPF